MFSEHESAGTVSNPRRRIEHYERIPAERDRLGLEFILVGFEDDTPQSQWLGGVQRLRIGQPARKPVDRPIIEQLVDSLDE